MLQKLKMRIAADAYITLLDAHEICFFSAAPTWPFGRGALLPGSIPKFSSPSELP
jgi:hypothetical protein